MERFTDLDLGLIIWQTVNLILLILIFVFIYKLYKYVKKKLE